VGIRIGVVILGGHRVQEGLCDLKHSTEHGLARKAKEKVAEVGCDKSNILDVAFLALLGNRLKDLQRRWIGLCLER
jgi:hypothetical protein